MRPKKPHGTAHGPEALLTVRQVAQRCQVDPRTVRRWTASGELPVVRLRRLVRIREHDLDAFIRDRLTG